MKALLGVLLGLAGVALAAYGAFQPWQHGRTGTHIPLADAFTGAGKAGASPATSVFLLIAIGMVVVLVGVVRSKPGPMFLGGLLALLPVVVPLALGHVAFGDLQAGAWEVLCGAGLTLVGASLRT